MIMSLSERARDAWDSFQGVGDTLEMYETTLFDNPSQAYYAGQVWAYNRVRYLEGSPCVVRWLRRLLYGLCKSRYLGNGGLCPFRFAERDERAASTSPLASRRALATIVCTRSRHIASLPKRNASAAMGSFASI